MVCHPDILLLDRTGGRTTNNTWDFRIGKRLHDSPKPREIGSRSSWRIPKAARASHNCSLAEETFRALNGPVGVNG